MMFHINDEVTISNPEMVGYGRRYLIKAVDYDGELTYRLKSPASRLFTDSKDRVVIGLHWKEDELIRVDEIIGPTPDPPQEIKYNFDPYKIVLERNDENMKNILDIYKERKRKEIDEKFRNKKTELKEKDKIQEIVAETNRLIQDTNPDRKFPEIMFNCYTDETLEKLEEIDIAHKIEDDNLNRLVEEIDALMSMATNFEEKMEILNSYGIIKKGKLNI